MFLLDKWRHGSFLKSPVTCLFAASGRGPGSWRHKQPGVWPCLSPPPSPWASSFCSSWNGGTRRTTRTPSKPSRPRPFPHPRSTCRRTRAALSLRQGPLIATGPARCAAASAQTPPSCRRRASSSATAASTRTWRPTAAARSPVTPANCNTSLRSTHQRVRTLELWGVSAENGGLVFTSKPD